MTADLYVRNAADEKDTYRTADKAEAVPLMELGAEETAFPSTESKPVEAELPVIASTQGPAITFFDLPKDIKIRILQYAGLLRPCLINIAFETHRTKTGRGICGNGNPIRMTRVSWTGTWVDPYNTPCTHPAIPIQALQTCRQARTELGAFFFTENHFSIYLYGRVEYRLFCAATRWGLKHLRNLHLDLGPRENRYLKLNGSLHKTTWTVWSQFCHNSTERMPALRRFSMKCKVKDLDIASRLMRTMEPFPLLAECAFHLSNKPDDDIRPVIKRAASRLTGNLDEKPSFSFTKLPKEVQLIVLEHLLCDCSDPYLPATQRRAGMVGFLDRKLHRTTQFPLACCGTCSPLRAMCFCEARQTAFSTTCSCFSSPLPYFLVSRNFYEDCRRIFFSRTIFTFVEEEPECIMRFLNTVPTSSFMQIRHLSFKFPKCWRTFHRSAKTEEIALLSWSVLRRFIREHFDLARLSLSIVDLGTTETMPNASRIRYMRKMLKAFSELQGLREFRVYLAADPSFEKELERAVTSRVSDERYCPYNMSTPEQHL
jgi:endonuclease-3